MAIVSIHAPAWGATLTGEVLGASYQFQFTLPHGERQGLPIHQNQKDEFQFTLPHGERHANGRREGGARKVSIHAPAWGATENLLGARLQTLVSIHAPAWGATPDTCIPYVIAPVSIHAPAWGATIKAASDGAESLVSIHAPAWGATANGHQAKRLQNVSIHAPAWGATRTGDAKGVLAKFQFTLPHGERPSFSRLRFDF